ncbi:rhamnulose-1-phosphate aldolase [Paenibacillus phyllosphaerae]|uniref:Rhamnulose-1-phosphate aldolase n=1 Tax=Paenibacillus phyllosphaerae TaxID=274593 RepID=A0A7W5FQV9_9BACL|nr:rhamnulose-1-phosphate aldolase [Paenibacillus phyllosphaerae]MBB3113713.1 rhamnulose-1-phosphate aldolase [Paenibacillus phyllosphaerae]
MELSSHTSLNAPFIQEMCEITHHMWKLGWDELNGGNVSCRLDAALVAEYMDIRKPIRTLRLSFPVHELAGEYFIVTGSGKYFRNVIKDPEANLGVLRVSGDGEQVEILWGLRDGALPTSELPSHFLSHAERLKADPSHRIVLHTHATNVIAMTFTHDLDEKRFTKTLWQMCTECLVVFPDGVGIVPWMVPGSNDIGRATAEKMKEFRVVIWPQHGIFVTGATMEATFGLVETIEKAATIYNLIGGREIRQTITDRQLIELAQAFRVTPRAGILE